MYHIREAGICSHNQEMVGSKALSWIALASTIAK